MKTGMTPLNTANQPTVLEIESATWIPFLARFTRNNRGAHARLEIVARDRETGFQVETENRQFDGISADVKDNEHTVWIAFGSDPDNHLSHGVHGVTAIRVLPRIGNGESVIEVESADGARNILYLTDPDAYSLPPAEKE
jgi:Family of unknown function (DUF5335)